MLIFGNDDNDDDLDFDGKQSTTPPASPTSSLPTRPASRSPFGSNADQVENLVPEKKTGLPTRIPSSPFGQTPPSNPGSKPRLPQNPLSEVKEPAPATPDTPASQKPKAPFSRPMAETPQNPVTPPTPPNLSSYLPRAKETTPAVEEPVSDPEPESKILSPQELYLREMKEFSQQNAAEAQRAEAERQSVTPAANIVAPVIYEAPPVVPTPALSEEAGKKKKKGFFSPPPPKAPQTTNKKSSPAKQARISQYDGERKKVLYIRLVAGTVAVIIAVAGVQAIFAGDNGPSKAQVQSAAKEAVNYTGFPTSSGEQFSLDFAKAYFNYDSNDATRVESLERFASKELVKLIDIQILSAAEFEADQKELKDKSSYSQLSVTESISYGPYIVNSKNMTAETAIYTVKVGLKSGAIVYLDVPVKYDPQNYSMTLAGPPSFSKPIQNQGSVATEDYTLDFEGGDDEALEKAEKSNLEAYLTAWAASDDVIIKRYQHDSASDNVKKGLQKSVKFNKIIDLKIEKYSEDKPSTEQARRVEVNVLWEDPKTGLRYPQQYRMLIAKNPDGKWAIHDIENFVVLNK